MKRSQINYAIDKAHAIAETFRICLPEFAGFTADFWSQKRAEEWQEVRDLQLGWDITDFGSGCFNETGLTLLTLRNGALSDARYPQTVCRENVADSAGSTNAMAFSLSQDGRHSESRRRPPLHAAGMGDGGGATGCSAQRERRG